MSRVTRSKKCRTQKNLQTTCHYFNNKNKPNKRCAELISFTFYIVLAGKQLLKMLHQINGKLFDNKPHVSILGIKLKT